MAGERILPGLGLTAYYLLGDNSWKPGVDENFRKLSFLAQASVLDVAATEPGSPSVGDAYIATGAWGPAAVDDLVIWEFNVDAVTEEWVKYTPSNGWIVQDITAGKLKKFVTGTGWTDPISAAEIATLYNGYKNAHYDIRFGFVETPGDAEVIDTIPIVREVTLPADMAGSIGTIGTNPAASFVMSVKDDAVEIGTITVSDAGVFTFATDSAEAKVIAAGSILTIEGPATADTTAEDLSVTLLGSA